MKLHSNTKAGIIPFLNDGRALFMVSSNPKFGGPDPAIAKGNVDKGETIEKAAVREGGEELGLKLSNMSAQPFLGWSGAVAGLQSTYPIEVYAVPVKDETDFSSTDYETERTVWMTRAQFKKTGRGTHRVIVDKIFDKIDTYLLNK
jgi:8-oxo-dGTP pyrophosphatase MutT (NUDIX family)